MATRNKRSSKVIVKRPGLDHLHPEVRAKAIDLAKGDRRRIEVVSKTEAIVR